MKISTQSVIKNELELKAAKICPSARKEQNSLLFNYRSEVSVKDVILVVSVFGQFLFGRALKY